MLMVLAGALQQTTPRADGREGLSVLAGATGSGRDAEYLPGLDQVRVIQLVGVGLENA